MEKPYSSSIELSNPSSPISDRRAHQVSLMRSLGQFFGHIVQGATADPGSGAASPPPSSPLPAPLVPQTEAQSVVIDHRVEEHTRQVPGGGGVIRVRRTIIEEVEMDPPAST